MRKLILSGCAALLFLSVATLAHAQAPNLPKPKLKLKPKFFLKPDLKITKIGGGANTLRIRVDNVGIVAAKPNRLFVLLYKYNPVMKKWKLADKKMVLLPVIAAKGHKWNSIQFAVPVKKSYVRAIVDYGNVVAEMSEKNNTISKWLP